MFQAERLWKYSFLPRRFPAPNALINYHKQLWGKRAQHLMSGRTLVGFKLETRMQAKCSKPGLFPFRAGPAPGKRSGLGTCSGKARFQHWTQVHFSTPRSPERMSQLQAWEVGCIGSRRTLSRITHGKDFPEGAGVKMSNQQGCRCDPLPGN